MKIKKSIYAYTILGLAFLMFMSTDVPLKGFGIMDLFSRSDSSVMNTTDHPLDIIVKGTKTCQITIPVGLTGQEEVRAMTHDDLSKQKTLKPGKNLNFQFNR